MPPPNPGQPAQFKADSSCIPPILQERAVMSQAETSQFVRELREALAQLDALPMPTVGEL